MKRVVIFPASSPLTVDPLEIINFEICRSEIRTFFKNKEDASVYEIKTVNLGIGSMFIGDNVAQDGNFFMAAPYDPMWAIANFVSSYRDLIELGLDDDHPELSRLFTNWQHLQALNLGTDNLDGIDSPRKLLEAHDQSKMLAYFEARYLSPERLRELSGHKLFKLITAAPLFAQKWSIPEKDFNLLSKAFALEILQEHLPADIIAGLCGLLGMAPPNDTAIIGKSKAEPKAPETNSKVIPKKRGGKTQAALDAEAKSSKRITSFFKPKAT